jgi:hypothetical protein
MSTVMFRVPPAASAASVEKDFRRLLRASAGRGQCPAALPSTDCIRYAAFVLQGPASLQKGQLACTFTFT